MSKNANKLPSDSAFSEHSSDSVQTGKRRRTLWPFLVIIGAVVLLSMLMMGRKQPPAKLPPKASGFLVETTTLEASDHGIEVSTQGVVKAKRDITLLPEISGKIIEVSNQFAVGGTFASGDVLVRIDPADYRVAVQRAKANLAAQQATLDLEQARSEQARKDWNSLGKSGRPSDLVLNIPQLDGAKAAVAAASADLAKAERDLDKTEIRAPFDGSVTEKHVDIGQFVTSATVLARVASSLVAEMRLPLTDFDLHKLDVTQLQSQPLPVHFSVEDGEIMGTLVRMETAKDSNTLVNHAVAELSRPLDAGILLNSFLNARIEGKVLHNAFKVPLGYMLANDQIALYKTGDDTLEIRDLTVAHRDRDYAYVTAGLSAQDRIITTPIQSPSAGMKLRQSAEGNMAATGAPPATEGVAANAQDSGNNTQE